MKERLLEISERLLATPTAPFEERWMGKTLDALLSKIPGVVLSVDVWGNRMARLAPAAVPGDAPGLVFVAHLDHPGFIVNGIDEATGLVKATFEGRVFDDYFEGQAVRLYRHPEDYGIRAIIKSASSEEPLEETRDILLEPESPAADAVIGMWDVPHFGVDGDILHGRACDDLCGVAAMICALERLAARPDKLTVPTTMFFTRAEEAGFCGALASVAGGDRTSVLHQDSEIVSVEISSARAGIQPGGGAILRVGDRATTFDQNLLHRLWKALRGRKDLPVRRALMDGGTCEATAFAAYDFRVAGICIPVVHYHNMDQTNHKIVAEQVSISDLETLCETIVTLGAGLEPAEVHRTDLQNYVAAYLGRAIRKLSPGDRESDYSTITNGETGRS